jgi:hypothetical protein
VKLSQLSEAKAQAEAPLSKQLELIQAAGKKIAVPKVLDDQDIVDAIEEAVAHWNAAPDRFATSVYDIAASHHTSAKGAPGLKASEEERAAMHPHVKEYMAAVEKLASMSKQAAYVTLANAARDKIMSMNWAAERGDDDEKFTCKMAMKGLGVVPKPLWG